MSVKEIQRRLCPYHEDSLGWDACSEDFEGCEVELAKLDALERRVTALEEARKQLPEEP